MVVVCLVHQAQQDHLENLASPENQEHLVHQAFQENHQSRHVMCQLHHHASLAQPDHPDHQDHQAMLARLDLPERQEDRVRTLQLESQARKAHQAHQVNRDAMVHPASPEHQHRTSHWNPESPDQLAMLDLQAHQDHPAHLDRMDSQDRKDQRDRKVRQAMRAKMDYPVNQAHQASLVLRERRESAPNTARWTVEYSSRMEREDKRTVMPKSLIAYTKNLFPVSLGCLLLSFF